MEQFIIEAIAAGGYLGIFLLMVLENVIPPVPSEVIMGVGGVLVARGEMEFWTLLAVGTTGATLGNCFWFWLGRRWGYEWLEPFIERRGRWLTMEWEDVEAATRFFRKHGQWVVFFLRFSPFLRTIVSFPAGIAQMRWPVFLGFTFAGSAIWNGFLIKGGEWLGNRFAESQEVLGWITFALIGIGVLGYLWRVATWKPRAHRGG